MVTIRWSLAGCVFFIVLLDSRAQFTQDYPWFCKSDEAVGPCNNRYSSLDYFNNHKVYGLIQKLLQSDFFKFYKVNMERPCPFWPDERECSSRECGIEHCDEEVPEALRRPSSFVSIVGEEEVDAPCVPSNQFDPLDRSLSDTDKAQLADMEDFEDSSDRFCDVEDDDSNDLHYVNLLKNPERYTGYKGQSAQKVWMSIYRENCFKPDPRFDKDFLLHPTPTGMCLEKRVFYKLISGLHSAITVSIASYNYKPAVGGFGSGTWFRNIEMFKNRFGDKWGTEGPERLMNVYFVYLLELRAIVKAAPYLQAELFYTGNEEEDMKTKEAMKALIAICEQYESHFDETKLFKGVESQARLLREEFRQHFVNISRIMDCVGCDKCRLWGKLQTHGMGTALKILFSDLPHSETRSVLSGRATVPFKLSRNEVVALIQSFGRYSSAIFEVDEFRRAMGIGLPQKTEL
ncbi:unnamed protein product [Bursaphelenchus okinawaensis]|uniref:Uncharacterized protein n=1 Tax=Bursaphelenchus okinawaensis TaxID=465554 RepID=A0A811JSX1_9BILA|nr:unnamed protein product [Bursaphelenchus okinawaensis]CAG9081485.1 unnamed protein product [Bursaphelenchus okinawaensis]